jgi:hypothetical protein
VNVTVFPSPQELITPVTVSPLALVYVIVRDSPQELIVPVTYSPLAVVNVTVFPSPQDSIVPVTYSPSAVVKVTVFPSPQELITPVTVSPSALVYVIVCVSPQVESSPSTVSYPSGVSNVGVIGVSSKSVLLLSKVVSSTSPVVAPTFKLIGSIGEVSNDVTKPVYSCFSSCKVPNLAKAASEAAIIAALI